MKKTNVAVLVFTVVAIGMISCRGRFPLNDKLFVAAAGTNTSEVAHLIARGANVNMISTELAKQTPLMIAAQFGSYDIVKLLLSKGADPNACDGTGTSILYYALTFRQENSNIVQLLMDNNAHLASKGERDFIAGLPDSPNKQAYERSSKKTQLVR